MIRPVRFDQLWARYGSRSGVSPELEPLARDLFETFVAEPINVEHVRASLERVLVFLASPSGRTDANCSAIDRFLCLGEFNWPDLPDAIQDVLGGIAGALHDTVSNPEIAMKFESTPEQLLRRLRSMT
jgi:hypothetical protein